MDPDSTKLTIALIFFAATMLFAFSALVESGIGSLSRARVQRLAEHEKRSIVLLERFLDHPATYLSIAATMRLATLIAATVVGTILLSGLSLRPATALIAGVILFISALFFGQIVPRTVASSHPEEIVLSLGPTFRLLSLPFIPLAHSANLLTNGLGQVLGSSTVPEGPVVTSEELRVMVAASEEEGLIEENEREMIDSILQLEETPVREIMVPRPDIVALPASATIREAINLFVEEGYSRLPVYRESIDDVLGILYGKDLLPLVRDGRLEGMVTDLARPALFVPESKKTDDLLRELQQRKVHIAIVVDEYGGTAGLVTIEDLLEEIVGEIRDEHDVEEDKIVANGADEATFAATVSIPDVNDTLNLHLESEEVETIGGLLYEKLGKVPIVGDQIRIDGALLTVVATTGRRIRRVRVLRQTSAASNGQGHSDTVVP